MQVPFSMAKKIVELLLECCPQTSTLACGNGTDEIRQRNRRRQQ